MSNVIGFRKPEPLVWVCECGCSTHRVYTTGAIECASCENIASISGGEWVKELPEPEAEPRESTPAEKVISLTGTPRQALSAMMRRVDPDTLIALVAINENGRVSTWGGVDTPTAIGWLRARLAEAEELLTTLVEGG